MNRPIARWLLVFAGVAALGACERDEADRLPVTIAGKQKAPEFADVAEWINSQPLKMAGLKGKVVVVHFMTFG